MVLSQWPVFPRCHDRSAHSGPCLAFQVLLVFLTSWCCTAGMAVFDTMRYVKADVSTVCVGLAASMGAFLLASGHQVGAASAACLD